MIDPTPLPAAPGADAAERFRALCDAGQSPDVDEFLARAGEIPASEAAAVLRVDQRERWRRGERVPAEKYLSRHPEVTADPESAVDLIFNEYLLREQCDARPDAEEFVRRFPEHVEVLRAQIELHQAVALGPEGGGFADGPSDRHDEEPLPPPEVPGYELLGEIGRGGMGVIYKARQEGLNRTVALKMISAGAHASAEERARLRTEAEAAARLQHPNIVQIYEVGSAAGVPYVALEYMAGGNLAAALDGTPLPPRVAAELVELLARAVQAAHEQGILHRDLKPANILLSRRWGARAGPGEGGVRTGERGGPGRSRGGETAGERHDAPSAPPGFKITDFGLAKDLSGRGAQTTTGAILGTPGYMAPEQAQGGSKHVGPAADVYALGAILYETLTGRPPFKAATVLDTLVQVRTQEVVSPDLLQQNLPRDLVTICLKSLAREPTRRYASAAALADDLQRFLTDKPIAARPVTSWERGWRWCRRNPFLAGVSAAALVLLVSALAALTAGIVAVNRERDHTQRALDAESVALEETRKQKAIAETNEAEARALLDFVENKIFAAARPPRQEGGLGGQVTLRRAIEAALPFVDQSFRNQPLIEARLRMTLGKSFAYLDERKIAADQFRAARKIYMEHLGPDDSRTLGSMNSLAVAYHDLGRRAEALKLREEVLALCKAKLGADHPETLLAMNNLASSYDAAGRLAEALNLHEKTLALRKAKFGGDHPDTLWSMNNLAIVYRHLGRRAEALDLREQVLALRKTKLGADHPDTLLAMNNVANSYRELGRHADALKLQNESLALRKATLGVDHTGTLDSMSDLANSYEDLGRHAEALKLREETLALRMAKTGANHPDTLLVMNNLANSYNAVGRHGDALKLHTETLAHRKAVLGPDHPDTLLSMNNLANTYYYLGRQSDALTLYKETLELQKSKLGPSHPDTLVTMYNIACNQAVLVPKSADRDKQADLAMDWLSRAVSAGFKDVAQISKDSDLDALRNRADFKKLLADLEVKAAKPRK